jgi:hypothetical protein
MPEISRFFGIIIRMYVEIGGPRSRNVVHPIFRVTGYEIVAGYTLRVSFDDGSEQVIDFEPVLAGEVYGPLKDQALFRQVRLDPEVRTLVWPNGADFDPATLHDWPRYRQELVTRAQGWARSAA